MSHYETVTKPALNALKVGLSAVHHAGPDALAECKRLIDAAAAAGATPNDLIEAVGGATVWNILIRAFKKEGLV